MAFLSLVILIDIITTSSRLFKQLALFGLEFLFGNDSLIFQFFIFFQRFNFISFRKGNLRSIMVS